MTQEFFRIRKKCLGDSHMLNVIIADRLNLPFLEKQDLCVRDRHQDR